MKGLIFKEFLEMVEKEHGYGLVDSIIQKSDIPSNGIYTSVGTYDFKELIALIKALSEQKQIPVNQILYSFGNYSFNTFLKKYPYFFENRTTSFDLLADVERKIHVEVLKLYTDAELPKFEVDIKDNNEMNMTYYSQRKMSDFAEGLISACLNYYNEEATIDKEYVEEDGSVVLFRIKKGE